MYVLHRSGSDLVLSAWLSVLFFRSLMSFWTSLYLGTHFFDLKAFFHPVEKLGTNVVFTGWYRGTHFFVLKSFFRPIKKRDKVNILKRELFSSEKFHSCVWHVPGIGTCPVSKITLVLWKNDLRQADNSEFPGVNHPCTTVCHKLKFHRLNGYNLTNMADILKIPFD